MKIPLLFVAAVALQAADIKPFDVKLGLWETTTTTEMGGMAMPTMPQIPPDALAKMPPEQRARIEAMMKGGGAGGPRTFTGKSCLTKESLEKAMAMVQDDKTCKATLVSSSATEQKIHMDCTRNNMHMTGDATVERVDTEHSKGTMTMKAEGEHAMTVKSSFQSKWISADCGDVKPK